MKVAVLTLTRDRLAYTQHCFGKLREHAGCEFDHYVLDQGSTDGSFEWLHDEFSGGRLHWLVRMNRNLGIAVGMNVLLDRVLGQPYDVVVKVDNDCEVVTPGTLAACADYALGSRVCASPLITGLRVPVFTPIPGTVGFANLMFIGGVFFAAPAWFYDGWRCPEDVAPWAGDDDLNARARALGLPVGYLYGYEANHYLTTDGQHADQPDYFARKRLEGCPC